MNGVPKRKVLILGGGIAGLATAFRLSELSRKRGLEIDFKLIEASDRFGGIIQTQFRNGFLIENGPDAFLTEKPWAMDLCRRLGLEQEIIPTNAASRRSFILKQGRLHPTPEGFYLVIPKTLKALMKMKILSLAAKLRMLAELVIPPAINQEDESVADFVRRRFGQEALTWLAQPMIAGMYSADPEKLSLRAAMPRLYELEKKYGSLIRGLKKESSFRETDKASGPRYSLFVSLKRGMGSLVDALVQKIPAESLIAGYPVQRLERNNGWKAYSADGTTWNADAVCLALPAYQASRLLSSISPEISRLLSEIRYESMATVTLAYPRKCFEKELQGFGFVVPEAESKKILGCTFCHIKFSGRVPSEDYVLLRAFVGSHSDLKQELKEPSLLANAVHEFLKKCLPLKEAPVLSSVSHYERAMPQYEIGYLQRLADIEACRQSLKGLYLTGNAYDGVGIPDVIHHAEQTAEKMMDQLAARRFEKEPQEILR